MIITAIDMTLFTTDELLTIVRTGKLNPRSKDNFSLRIQESCKREATRRMFADMI